MGTFRIGPLDRITDLSIKFSSSRTFPGQFQLRSASIASVGIIAKSLFVLRAYFFTKNFQ